MYPYLRHVLHLQPDDTRLVVPNTAPLPGWPLIVLFVSLRMVRVARSTLLLQLTAVAMVAVALGSAYFTVCRSSLQCTRRYVCLTNARPATQTYSVMLSLALCLVALYAANVSHAFALSLVATGWVYVMAFVLVQRYRVSRKVFVLLGMWVMPLGFTYHEDMPAPSK